MSMSAGESFISKRVGVFIRALFFYNGCHVCICVHALGCRGPRLRSILHLTCPTPVPHISRGMDGRAAKPGGRGSTGTAGLLEPGEGISRVSRDAPPPAAGAAGQSSGGAGDDDDDDDLFSVRAEIDR